MGSLTVTADRIVRQAANTIPGNATGAEAACQSLTPSQLRTFLGLGTADSPSFSGLTLAGDLLFNANNTYDVGNGTYNPRTVRAATSVLTPLLNNTNAAALILGNSTYGVTVPGKLSIGRSPSGATTALDVYNASASVQATIQSGNNFCELLLTSGSTAIPNYITSNGNLSFIVGGSERAVINQSTGTATFSGDVSMSKTSAQGYIRAYATDGVKNVALYDDGTNGILSTSSGRLNLVPAGGTVAVTGAVTTSDLVTIDGPTGASGGVTALNITDGANATFRLSFENASRIMLSGNEGDHNLSFGGKSGNSGSSPFTERFRVDNVANQVVSYSPFVCTSITASGIFSLTANYQTLSDGVNIVCGTTTGTKIATGATQKLSFWGVTPVVQPASANQAALSLDSDVTGGDTVDKAAVDANFAAIQTLVNQLRSDLVAAGIIKGAA